MLIGQNFTLAKTVFDEDFEKEPYFQNEPIPTGEGIIHYGSWLPLGKHVQDGKVVTKDGGQSLELRCPDYSDHSDIKARVIGILGQEGGYNKSTEQSLKIRIRFQVSQIPDESLYFQILGSDGKSRATIGMGEWGGLTVRFSGEVASFGPIIEPEVWYELEWLLPANPTTTSIYTVSLYTTDGKTSLDSQKGRVSRSVEEGGNSYKAIDIQHKTPNTSLYIKFVKAETLTD